MIKGWKKLYSTIQFTFEEPSRSRIRGTIIIGLVLGGGAVLHQKEAKEVVRFPHQAEINSGSVKVSLLQKININTATAEELESLNGIGKVLALRIIAYRKAVGGFKNADALQDLIYPKARLDSLIPYLIFDSTTIEQVIVKQVKQNINLATAEDITNAGLPLALAKRLIKFRNGAKGFYTWDEVKIAYGMNESYIQLLQAHFYIQPTIALLDINSATEAELEALPLIGTKRAQAIIKYRSLLGFYANIQQLSEVYTIDTKVFNVIAPRCTTIITNQAPKIAINTVDAYTLSRHPYFRKNGLAKKVVEHRYAYGKFQHIDDLAKIDGVSPELLGKLQPYISLE